MNTPKTERGHCASKSCETDLDSFNDCECPCESCLVQKDYEQTFTAEDIRDDEQWDKGFHAYRGGE